MPRCQGPSRRGPGPRHQRLIGARTPGRVNAPLRQSARAAPPIRSAPGAELAPGAYVGFKGTPPVRTRGTGGGYPPVPGAPALPIKDPRGPKKGQKMAIFGPLRRKVQGEWGGSAHSPDPTAQSVAAASPATAIVRRTPRRRSPPPRLSQEKRRRRMREAEGFGSCSDAPSAPWPVPASSRSATPCLAA